MATSIITGGAGFLGSHVVDVLAKRGEDVVVLDNLTTGRLANLAGAISSGRVTFVYADVAVDTATLRGILERAGVAGKIDKIFHFASADGCSANQALHPETFAAEMVGTLSLIDIAVERSARFILSSTSEMYGDPPEQPQSEGHPQNVNRCLGEAAVAAAVENRNLDARIVRFFGCYGPRMHNRYGGLILALLDAVLEHRPFPIHGTGKQALSMVYVSDAIELLLLATAVKQKSLAPVDIGSDDERSVIEIAQALAAALSTDFAAEFIAGRERDRRRLRPELSRAFSLGWSARTSLENGLRSTYDWYAKESPIFV